VSSDLCVVRETLITTVPQAVRQSVIMVGRPDLHLCGLVETLADHARSIPLVMLAIAVFAAEGERFLEGVTGFTCRCK